MLLMRPTFIQLAGAWVGPDIALEPALASGWSGDFESMKAGMMIHTDAPFGAASNPPLTPKVNRGRARQLRYFFASVWYGLSTNPV